MDLKIEISKLVKLQKIDIQIHALRKEKDEDKPAELTKLKAEFEEKKKALEAIDKEVKESQLRRKNKELDLATKEEAARKAQAQLYQLKTNKEYQAKLSEIASLKADVSLLEEDVLRALDAIEEAEKKLTAVKAELAAQEKKFKEEENKIANRVRDIEAQITTLEDKRNIFVKDVEPTILSRYEKLLSTRSGLAIVPVDNESCGACHMRVTAQSINEIKMYKNLIFCESCVRILYVSEDVSE
jgi:hypothetical protein